MLFGDDVVAQRKAQTCALTSWFGGEEALKTYTIGWASRFSLSQSSSSVSVCAQVSI